MKYNFFIRQFSGIDVQPDKVAIAGSDGDLSWEALQAKVEKLSDVFKQLNIPQGHPVMIYGHKEAFYPAAVLACIHSGITYIPTDVIYPDERILKIKNQTGSRIIINCRETALVGAFDVSIGDRCEPIVRQTPDYSNATYTTQGDALQYIMFTSGSTGEPKGVQITRGNVLAFLDWASRDFPFTGNDVFMNQVPFTFDVSLCDIILSLSLGGTLVLNSAAMVQNQDLFLERIAHYGCTVWTSTPSFVFLYMRHASFNPAYLRSLRTFFFMGEDLPNRTCTKLRSIFPSCRILNAYGPTEATIVTTLVEITDDILRKYPSLPIGYAMPASHLFTITDDEHTKEGELVICGHHVSPGYFKNSEQTALKFMKHNGLQAFKTGDLSYEENGMFFYCGRNDDLVKMHGFRIELSEISNALCRSPLIDEAVTVPLKRNHDVKKIVSFVLPAQGTSTEGLKEKLQGFLGESLPYYMIPGDICAVEEFPYNSSHKIDKKKLAEEYVLKMQ